MPTDSEHTQLIRDRIGGLLDALNGAITDGLHVRVSLNVPDTETEPIDVGKVGLVRVFRSIYSSERDGPVRPPRPSPGGPPGPE